MIIKLGKNGWHLVNNMDEIHKPNYNNLWMQFGDMHDD